MGTKQVKSPEILAEKSPMPKDNYGSFEDNVKSDPYSDSFHRKKLGKYFAESDERQTSISGGYIGGATPVTIHGKPIENLPKTGGWIAAFFIFGVCIYPFGPISALIYIVGSFFDSLSFLGNLVSNMVSELGGLSFDPCPWLCFPCTCKHLHMLNYTCLCKGGIGSFVYLLLPIWAIPALIFIFGPFLDRNEMAERMAYFGLSVNMVAFMFYVMHRPFSSSANAVNNFLGISQASSVLGGFLADAYLGRYWTIAIFTTLYLLGLIGITLCATLKVLMPSQANCDKVSILLGTCEPAKSWQMLYLYSILYITGFGAAGIRPCVSSFGADQFDERRSDYKSLLDRFFNFFYLSVTIGAIVAFTMVVYIQMKHGWASAFASLAIAMAISNVIFFLGTPLYRHRLPGGSPLTRMAQVLVAAFRKRNASFSSSELVGLYELPGKRSAIKGSGKITHTDDFRCLDKAALQLKEDGTNPSPWRLCTVTQVEEVKILVKLLPIPACTIMLSVILTEFLTLSVQQAYTLNTHMGRLKLPVTCMPVFPGLSIFLILSLYYSTFVPLSRRITGHPHGASQLQRVGIGLAVSIFSVAWAGVFERYRRNYAVKHGYEYMFLTAMPNLSAFWLLIQYCLIGIAEVFCIVGLLEFLYEEAPDAMRSVGSAYAAVAGGLGCFAATILNNIVESITRNKEEGRPSWLSQNINTGRFDYLYWLLAVLSVINFCIFLYCAWRYEYRTRPVFEAELNGGGSSEGKRPGHLDG